MPHSNQTIQTILNDFEFLKAIYNKFSPDTPLPAGDPAYVFCSEVRGNENILEIGKTILFSDTPTCQLYTGHRGGGKSTEILRLKKYLEENKCRVIYFEADTYIDLQNVTYGDILLSCTRNIVENLQNEANKTTIDEFYSWLNETFKELIDIGLSEVQLKSLGIEQQISPLNKITATLKFNPNKRQAIRQQIDNFQESFTTILNSLIKEAEEKLAKNNQSKLVVIADNLDRLPVTRKDDGSTNQEEIFIDHSLHLKSLACHVVYTVPISLVYSNRSAILRDSYGDTEVLPMIMVRDRHKNSYQPGIDKMKDIISKRVNLAIKEFPKANNLNITCDDLFDDSETLNLLCQITGGHVREIMFLMQTSIRKIERFPLTKSALNQAIAIFRNTYKDAVDHEDWEKLVYVYIRGNILNQEDYRHLLFSRCILEYRDSETLETWFSLHPMVEALIENSNIMLNSLKRNYDFMTTMNTASKLYDKFVDKKEYNEASNVANFIYQMCEDHVKSLASDQDSDEYIDAMAWSSYWKLRSDLYKSRSGI